MLVGGDSGVDVGRGYGPGSFGDGGARDRDVPQEHDVLDGQWDDGVPDGPRDGRDMYGGYGDEAFSDGMLGDEPFGDAAFSDGAFDDDPFGDGTFGDEARAGSTCGDPACRGAAASEDLADELPRLMARLGQLIALHGPAGVVAMARSEAERRELAAYAAGWQDAAAEFAPRVAAARRDGWLGRWRPLRVLNGPGDVIPFPVARQYAHPGPHQSGGEAVVNGWDAGLDAGHDGTGPDTAQDRGYAPGRDVPPGPETGLEPGPGSGRGDTRPGAGSPRTPGARGPGARTDDDSAHGGRDEDEPTNGEEPSATRSHGEPGRQERAGQRPAQGPRPSLPAKSRWSRSPTIPRLAPPSQRPPGRGPDGTPPPDAPA